MSRSLAPVTSLGPGRRVALWVQGCTLACRGCASVDTWDADGGTETTPAEVIDLLAAAIIQLELTGLTVTGGEPFEQPAEVAQVIHGVRERVRSARRSAAGRSGEPEIDVLVFTGFSTRVARRRAPHLFSAADALVCGRYDPRLTAGGPLLATANQELVITTELGAQRFSDLSDQPSLQVAAINGDLMVVGIPRAGDLDRVAAELDRHGITFEGVTWH